MVVVVVAEVDLHPVDLTTIKINRRPEDQMPGLLADSDLLARVADIPLTPTRFAEPDGTERLLVRLPEGDTFVRIALDDVIATARTSPMVLQHLHHVLEQVREHARPDRRDPLTYRLSCVDKELTDRFPHLPAGRPHHREIRLSREIGVYPD